MRVQPGRIIFYLFAAMLLTCPLSCAGFLAWQYQLGQREYDAYRQLRALGATGDDWVGLREFLNPKFRPIEQISLPPTLSVEQALPWLLDLDHLEALEIHSDVWQESDFEAIQQLNGIKHIAIGGKSIEDRHIPKLATLKNLRTVYVDNSHITEEGIHQLKRELPGCKVFRDGKQL